MPQRAGVCLATFNAQFAVSRYSVRGPPVSIRLDFCRVNEYHSFITSGFGASMINAIESVVNINEHTMPGSGHDAALLCVLL